jgi:hypothetical protein
VDATIITLSVLQSTLWTLKLICWLALHQCWTKLIHTLVFYPIVLEKIFASLRTGLITKTGPLLTQQFTGFLCMTDNLLGELFQSFALYPTGYRKMQALGLIFIRQWIHRPALLQAAQLELAPELSYHWPYRQYFHQNYKRLYMGLSSASCRQTCSTRFFSTKKNIRDP